MEAILQCRQPLWIDKCLLLTIFITSLYTDQLWHNCLILFVCLFSCAQLSLIANHTERTRGGKTWLQVSIVFCVVGPPMLNNRPDCLSTFLPSFLSDPRLAELKYCHGNGSFPSRAKEFGKKDDLNLTCTLERCRVMGEEFLEVEVQVTGF